MAVRAGPKLLSQHEFSVIVFAASGISARSRRVSKARFTVAVEGSKRAKKTILHQDCRSSKLR
jgi:hypothetical protein